jgi:hypothetical protein
LEPPLCTQTRAQASLSEGASGQNRPGGHRSPPARSSGLRPPQHVSVRAHAFGVHIPHPQAPHAHVQSPLEAARRTAAHAAGQPRTDPTRTAPTRGQTPPSGPARAPSSLALSREVLMKTFPAERWLFPPFSPINYQLSFRRISTLHGVFPEFFQREKTAQRKEKKGLFAKKDQDTALTKKNLRREIAFWQFENIGFFRVFAFSRARSFENSFSKGSFVCWCT